MVIALETPQDHVISVRWPASFDEDDFARFRAEFLAYIDEADHFATILDCRNVRIRIAAPMRALIVDFINQVNARTGDKELATIYVIDAPLIRRTATAIFWFTTPDCPRHVVATRDEAMALASQAVKAHTEARR